MYEGGHEMDIPNVDGVDEQHVIEVHLENLLKLGVALLQFSHMNIF
jgi:hypothetical protein